MTSAQKRIISLENHKPNDKVTSLVISRRDERGPLNAEFCKKALEKVGNPNILVNLISRRVRQLSAGGGGLGRPLVSETATMGSADIAMLELVEDKMTWEPEDDASLDPSGKKKKKA